MAERRKHYRQPYQGQLKGKPQGQHIALKIPQPHMDSGAEMAVHDEHKGHLVVCVIFAKGPTT